MDKKTADRCIQWWRDNPEEGDRILKEIRSDIGFTTQDHTIQEWYSRALRRVKKEEKVTKWHLSAETTRLMKEWPESFHGDDNFETTVDARHS